MIWKFYLLFIAALFSLTAFSQKVKVVGIADGDSFTALFADHATQRIRLHGIDCPERGQPFSNNAKQFTSSQIFGKEVFLKQTDTDRYGRMVALVYLPDSSLLNEKLLSAGLAWHFLRYDRNPQWSIKEKEARSKKLGLWAGSENPIEPWLWRKRKPFLQTSQN
ncbi:MAG: hypothetical protein BGN92_04445 [Sphingobacteriales bacterium 41-5]|nr:MAG: hypothetical protein BGN92_04445 [Sphingobacteriales bacterium 41-5]